MNEDFIIGFAELRDSVLIILQFVAHFNTIVFETSRLDKAEFRELARIAPGEPIGKGRVVWSLSGPCVVRT